MTKLPYFDCTQVHVVDPMHNLLGTAKHIVNVWVTNEIITGADFDKIQEIVDSLTILNDVGRIPCRGGSRVGSGGCNPPKLYTRLTIARHSIVVVHPEHGFSYE